MKAFKVTYSHGQFIDKNTNKRIIPKQGAEYIINADTNRFLKIDIKINNYINNNKLTNLLDETQYINA